MMDPLTYFSFYPVIYDWCNKGHSMCYPVCGMVHINYPLLLTLVKDHRDNDRRNLLLTLHGLLFLISSKRSFIGTLRGKCSLMVRWVVGSILRGVDRLSYFSFQPVLHDWCNKGHGMCYPVCGMVHINYPLLLTEKNSPCSGGSRYLL